MLDVARYYRIGLPLYREKPWLREATYMYVRTRRFARCRHRPHAQCIYSTQILWTFSGVWGGSSEPPEPPLATRLAQSDRSPYRLDQSPHSPIGHRTGSISHRTVRSVTAQSDFFFFRGSKIYYYIKKIKNNKKQCMTRKMKSEQ